jgi:aconitate hydratase
MISLSKNGAWLVNGTEIIPDDVSAESRLISLTGGKQDKDTAKKGTISYGILRKHNTSDNMKNLKIKFDALASHDITFVGIIQTARASGLKEFPIPYALTNCHNSLCAVGGTINEDDHMFGLSCAQKYGGIFVPPHIAVIHQFAREMLTGGGKMILGSDSHTRYGALGTMAIGEGGPELVKQLLGKTYDVNIPEVIGIHLTGKPARGVGPQDISLAIIGTVFPNGYVKNKIMEFFGDGVSNLSVDYRIGIDVMTTETTCLSSIWTTDDKVKEFYEIHGRPSDYVELKPEKVAYYDGIVDVDLSKIKPMIAMPFHPSNAYTIEDLNANLDDILSDVEKRAKISLGDSVDFTLHDKIHNGRLLVDQGVIAGCAGGGFENLCDASDILNGKTIGSDAFSLSIYPASQPILLELMKNGSIAKLMESGAIIRTAFCGPCFGAGDVPCNRGFSIRHSTRNFPNREGSKINNGQIASVALMDARSIAATAANQGYLTAATDIDTIFTKPKYFFDSSIYDTRVYNGVGKADPSVELRFGPNIKDWPEMIPLTDNILLKVISVINDPVTTTDELIPSGETSSYRSNPEALAEFTLSRKDPSYVGRAKTVRTAEQARRAGSLPESVLPELTDIFRKIKSAVPDFIPSQTSIGSVIFTVKPGDGSAREQAASCQKVLGGMANIATEYATKRYRSNLINWGMLPFLTEKGSSSFNKGDYIFIPNIRKNIEEKNDDIKAFVISDSIHAISLSLGQLSDTEREIILSGCLINYYKSH